jgi:hypothetical protein
MKKLFLDLLRDWRLPDKDEEVYSEIHLLGRIRHRNDQGYDSRTSFHISLRKTGKRLHTIFEPGLWPRKVQSLPAPPCII